MRTQSTSFCSLDSEAINNVQRVPIKTFTARDRMPIKCSTFSMHKMLRIKCFLWTFCSRPWAARSPTGTHFVSFGGKRYCSFMYSSLFTKNDGIKTLTNLTKLFEDIVHSSRVQWQYSHTAFHYIETVTWTVILFLNLATSIRCSIYL